MRKIAVPSAILAAVLLAVLGVVLAQDGAVQVSESGFSPQVITVPVRTVVTWTNVGAALPHRHRGSTASSRPGFSRRAACTRISSLLRASTRTAISCRRRRGLKAVPPETIGGWLTWGGLAGMAVLWLMLLTREESRAEQGNEQ